MARWRVGASGRFALGIGETSNGTFGESIVIDFGVAPPQISTSFGGMRVLQFVTAAIDFHPDGRAFVCRAGRGRRRHPPFRQRWSFSTESATQ